MERAYPDLFTVPALPGCPEPGETELVFFSFFLLFFFFFLIDLLIFGTVGEVIVCGLIVYINYYLTFYFPPAVKRCI